MFVEKLSFVILPSIFPGFWIIMSYEHWKQSVRTGFNVGTLLRRHSGIEVGFVLQVVLMIVERKLVV
jgi:hypothetical protein